MKTKMKKTESVCETLIWVKNNARSPKPQALEDVLVQLDENVTIGCWLDDAKEWVMAIGPMNFYLKNKEVLAWAKMPKGFSK